MSKIIPANAFYRLKGVKRARSAGRRCVDGPGKVPRLLALFQRKPLDKGAHETGIETVSGANGIHYLFIKESGKESARAVLLHKERSPGAALDHHDAAKVRKHLPDSAGGVMATRDILLAEFDRLAILVNHHPSQLGGKAERRELAQARLRALTDSLHAGGQPRTLAVGDFNQDLWGEIPGQARNGYNGTIKYNGQWEKIDGGFAEGFLRVREEIFADPLLLEEDKAFGGRKPRRTFVGPRYTGGVSDHLPVVFVVYF